MKNLFQPLLIFVILLMGTTTNVNAQQLTCYDEYKKLFTERGSAAIPDGTHEVVVTMRSDDKTDCYTGKVQVVSNQIVKFLGIYLEDGTLHMPDIKLSNRYASGPNSSVLTRDIVNGMSSTIITDDDVLINIFFVKQLNSKAKVFKHAPPASTF
jgi:hypothetical protein